MYAPVYAAAQEDMGFRAHACVLQGAEDSLSLQFGS